MVKKTDLRELPAGALVPSETNPRKSFSGPELNDLAASIKEKGVLEPLLVRPHSKAGIEMYEIVAGERRWRAAKIAGLKTLPCISRTLNDEQVVEIQIIENMQRADLTPMEEAAGYKQLHEVYNHDYDELAVRIGKSRSYIYNRLKLLSLSPAVRKAVNDGTLKLSWAEQLIVVKDHKDQDAILKDAVEYTQFEDIEDLKSHIKNEFLTELSRAPFNTKDDKLVPVAGACTTCPKHTFAQPDLFGDFRKKDACLDRKCWQKKVLAHSKNLIKKYTKEGKEILSGDKAVKAINRLEKMEETNYSRLKSGVTWEQALKNTEYEPVFAVNQEGRVYKLVDPEKAYKFVPKSKRESANERSIARTNTQKSEKKRALQLKKVVAIATDKVIEKAAGEKLKGPFLKLITELVMKSAGSDATRETTKRMGFEPAKRKSSYGGYDYDYGAPLRKYLKEGGDKEALTLMLQLFIGAPVYIWSSDIGRDLQLLCKYFRIDVSKIRAKVAREEKAKKAAKKKPVKKTKKKGKK